MTKDFVEDIKGAEVYDLGDCPSGEGHIGLHKDGSMIVGHARSAEPGTPLHPGECILYTEGGKVVDGYEQPATSSGPAQVATKEYRDNYDRIFGDN